MKRRANGYPKHVKFMRRLAFEEGCVICQRPAEAAHIRFSDASWGKVNPGTGDKDDRWIVPLCPDHHRTGPDAQHGVGEREWWERHGIDPLPLAKQLYDATGDYERACAILRGVSNE